MKTLQNNFTTPEQSKRLLELGVPADSADYYFEKCTGDICIIKKGTFSTFCDNSEIPCWSVGRLIEIICICSTAPFPNEITITRRNVDLSVMKTLIERFEELANYYSLDFSKLEK